MFVVMHLVDNLGIGGAQSMLFELYHAIDKYYPEYEQLIISNQNRSSDEKFIRSSNISYVAKRSTKDVIKKILSRRKSVVFYHKLASSVPTIVKAVKKQSKIPVIIINHTFFDSKSWRGVNFCDAIVAVSHHMNKKLKSWHPKFKRYRCIHNGVNFYRYKKIKPTGRPELKILLTGRINRICGWKYSDKWTEWCATVKLPKKMIHQYIGDGPYLSRAKASARKKNRGRNEVQILGLINNFKTKISILKSWDLFLYETNRNEGISMAILEALACGVPVICSNHYGNKEIIKKGINGYIFKDKNEAKKILTKLCSDPNRLAALKQSTMQHFKENLDAKYTAKKYINLIEEVVGKPMRKEKSIIEINNIPKEKKIEEHKEISQKFTIITSSYNKAKYLYNWSKSILSQKYRPLEVIIANDKSVDNSLEILNKLKDSFKKEKIEFKIINNEKRLYCGSSYRNLVDSITGSYIGVVDADDMLADDAIEYIMKLYNKYMDVAWIYTQFLICDINMKKKRKGFCRAPGKRETLLSLADKGIHGYGHWRTFNYKIKRPDKLFARGLKCSVDKYMGYRLEEFGPGLFVNKVCYKYRQYPVGFKESVSSTKHAMDVWKKVVKEVHNRRKRYNYKAFPIYIHDEKNY